MNITDNYIEIENKDFNVSQTLECGQCFRFKKIDENRYLIIAKEKALVIEEIDSIIRLYCGEEDYKKIWEHYFDLERDYSKIKKSLSKKDKHISKAIKEKYGVRILNQEPWEMLISFIISQSKQITHIKKIIEDISIEYGENIGEIYGYQIYSFPKVEKMKNVTEEDLRDLKLGYRAPYIIDAIDKILRKEVDLSKIFSMEIEEGRKELLKIKGVGNKIADCVLLFAYGKHEVFPTDVWVKRVMEHYYYEEETTLEEIQRFSKEYFGDNAGFAQQYLFYYGRENKLGKEKRR